MFISSRAKRCNIALSISRKNYIEFPHYNGKWVALYINRSVSLDASLVNMDN